MKEDCRSRVIDNWNMIVEAIEDGKQCRIEVYYSCKECSIVNNGIV